RVRHRRAFSRAACPLHDRDPEPRSGARRMTECGRIRRACMRVALACSLVAAGSTFAHPLSPGLLQLEELGGSRYSVLWKLPSTSFDAVRLVPDLPAACREV